MIREMADAPALPTLIVVSGSPGSGKTTLSYALARAVPCPVVSRDEIREGLMATRSVNAALGDAADYVTDLARMPSFVRS